MKHRKHLYISSLLSNIFPVDQKDLRVNAHSCNYTAIIHQIHNISILIKIITNFFYQCDTHMLSQVLMIKNLRHFINEINNSTNRKYIFS